MIWRQARVIQLVKCLLGPSRTSEKVLRVLLAQAQKCFTHYWYTVWVQHFVGLKFPFLLKHLYYKIFEGFNFCGFVVGVITAPFSDYSCATVLVDQWTSDGEGKQHTEFLFSGWTKVTKERHSRACLAQRRRVFLRGRSLTKFSSGLFFAVWLVPSKTAKFNHPQKFVPLRKNNLNNVIVTILEQLRTNYLEQF